MQRQDLSPEATAFIAEKRAYHEGEANSGADDMFPEKDRRNRTDVLGPLSRLKRDDDVYISNQVVRVIGPARDERWFYALSETPWGFYDVPFDGQHITDRAPADPNEEPMPIFVEPEEDGEPPSEPPPDETPPTP